MAELIELAEDRQKWILEVNSLKLGSIANPETNPETVVLYGAEVLAVRFHIKSHENRDRFPAAAIAFPLANVPIGLRMFAGPGGGLYGHSGVFFEWSCMLTCALRHALPA